jgi:hypothetical protein
MGLRCGGGLFVSRGYQASGLFESDLMSSVDVQHYLGRARDFLEGMEILKNDPPEYRYSSALLGIHSAMSYGDALRVGLGSRKVSSQDHRGAAKDLRSLLDAKGFEKPQGVDRLRYLLAKKSRTAYGSETPGNTEIQEIVLQAERFAAWAEESGRKLKIEGW